MVKDMDQQRSEGTVPRPLPFKHELHILLQHMKLMFEIAEAPV
jgi:hypothetical protein